MRVISQHLQLKNIEKLDGQKLFFLTTRMVGGNILRDDGEFNEILELKGSTII